MLSVGSSAGVVSLYPNPVHQQATLSIASITAETLQLRLLDKNSRLVYSKAVIAQAGNHAFTMQTAPPPAVYTLNVRGTAIRKKIK